MAIWQFDILLIPREVANAGPLCIVDRMLDSLHWWDNRQPPSDIIRRFDALLPRGRAWSEGEMQWGNDDETCLRLFRRAGRIDGTEIRLDMRERDVVAKYVDQIVVLARDADCKLCLMEGPRVIDAEPGTLRAAIEGSWAKLYVSDPTEYWKRTGEERQRRSTSEQA